MSAPLTDPRLTLPAEQPPELVTRIAMRNTKDGRIILRHAVDVREIIWRNEPGEWVIDEHQNYHLGIGGRQDPERSTRLAATAAAAMGEIELARRITQVGGEDRFRLTVAAAARELQMPLSEAQVQQMRIARMEEMLHELGIDPPPIDVGPAMTEPEAPLAPPAAPQPEPMPSWAASMLAEAKGHAPATEPVVSAADIVATEPIDAAIARLAASYAAPSAQGPLPVSAEPAPATTTPADAPVPLPDTSAATGSSVSIEGSVSPVKPNAEDHSAATVKPNWPQP